MAAGIRIADYDRIVCLCVDHRHAAEWPRVRALIRDRGGEAVCFLEGKGEILPRAIYDRISTSPPPSWGGPYGAFQHFEAMRAIVRSAVADGVESLLFLEDDVTFVDGFDEALETASRQLEARAPDWCLLYYGANHEWAEVVGVASNLLRVQGSLATHCLGIRRGAFDPILGLPPTHPIDVLIARDLHPRLPCYSLTPSLAVQKPGYSHIVGQYVDYSKLF